MRIKAGDRMSRFVKTVYLDNKALECCTEFDTEEGWASVWVLDRNGKVKTDRFAPVRRILYGRITLKLCEGYAILGDKIVAVWGEQKQNGVGLLFEHLIDPQHADPRLWYFGDDGEPIDVGGNEYGSGSD